MKLEAGKLLKIIRELIDLLPSGGAEAVVEDLQETPYPEPACGDAVSRAELIKQINELETKEAHDILNVIYSLPSVGVGLGNHEEKPRGSEQNKFTFNIKDKPPINVFIEGFKVTKRPDDDERMNVSFIYKGDITPDKIPGALISGLGLLIKQYSEEKPSKLQDDIEAIRKINWDSGIDRVIMLLDVLDKAANELEAIKQKVGL